MDAGREKESEKIEINCPCGHGFEVYLEEGKNEFPCPACSRINVLLDRSRGAGGASDKKGETTIQTISPVHLPMMILI